MPSFLLVLCGVVIGVVLTVAFCYRDVAISRQAETDALTDLVKAEQKYEAECDYTAKLLGDPEFYAEERAAYRSSWSLTLPEMN